MTNWTDRDTQDLRRIGEIELGDPLTESDLDTIAMAANEIERLQARVVELEENWRRASEGWHRWRDRCLESESRDLLRITALEAERDEEAALREAAWGRVNEANAKIATLEAEMRAASARTRELRMLLVGAVKFLQTVLAGTPDTSRISRFVDEATDYLNRTSDPSDILRNISK